MPKKFSLTDKRKWLEKYEKGKSEVAIAAESRCDTRTVKKGIDEARREQDARAARTELLKQALFKHQEKLSDELKKISSPLMLPPKDWVVLSWYRNGDSIFDPPDITKSRAQTHEVDKPAKPINSYDDMFQDMLREHLRNDKLWKILAHRERAYNSHRLEKMALQLKVVALLQEETGCKMVDRNDVQSPFLYSYTAGGLFFKMALRYSFGNYDNDDWMKDVIADTTAGNVISTGQILAHVPGNERLCAQKFLGAFKKIKLLPEIVTVADTFRQLEEATLKVKQAVEELLALGLIPGQCKVCRRLGM
jgi:hypothetical protein